MKEGPPKIPTPDDQKKSGLEALKRLGQQTRPIQPVEDWTPELQKREAQGVENQIRKAGNFDDLFKTLERMGGLQGSTTFYSAKELKQLINEVRKGEKDANYITRTAGLREHIIWLTMAERNEKGSGTMPKVGEMVMLTKRSLDPSQDSRVGVGTMLKGKLMKDIQIGQQILLDGGQTSTVRGIRSEKGLLYVDTETSTYEVSRG